jgi:hypothetical protein
MQRNSAAIRTAKTFKCEWKTGHFTGSGGVAQGQPQTASRIHSGSHEVNFTKPFMRSDSLGPSVVQWSIRFRAACTQIFSAQVEQFKARTIFEQCEKGTLMLTTSAYYFLADQNS